MASTPGSSRPGRIHPRAHAALCSHARRSPACPHARRSPAASRAIPATRPASGEREGRRRSSRPQERAHARRRERDGEAKSSEARPPPLPRPHAARVGACPPPPRPGAARAPARRHQVHARGLPGAGSWPLLPPELVLTGDAPAPPTASRGGRGQRASRGGWRWRLRLAAARRGSSAAAAVREGARPEQRQVGVYISPSGPRRRRGAAGEAVRQRCGPRAAREPRLNDGTANPGPASLVLPPARVERRAFECSQGSLPTAYMI